MFWWEVASKKYIDQHSYTKCFDGGGGLSKYVDHPPHTKHCDGVGVYKIYWPPPHTKNVLIWSGAYKKDIDPPDFFGMRGGSI